VKKFAARPMDVEEAILQMNLVGHDFFVFLNADTEAINVVYKRKHGKYGLITPEY
jgi:putative sigma-54 modulation protein